ncbi:MAG TPA: bifunctional DNA-formamidopyrimidine glycosylase/DNA-(apurinic or apyrimidinic site) lyase [Candidatus Acetothermia bacterium]|nr:bifunctional DNA-formamidopyrimidine glycosylase/DNA-(apurinic or apyrimidinic site) lyase [Candidatus Acetothermia bacterium]
MPELPEVETIVRGLRPHVVGKALTAVEVEDPKLDSLRSAFVLPATVRSIERRGKHVLFDLGDRVLVLHPRMSGRIVWGRRKPRERVRLSLRFADGGVYFVDPRRLGTAKVVREFSDDLGPEPLGDLAWLPSALQGSRMPVKFWLMDQRKIAGIGNIYAAEILFRAGIAPRRRADSLSRSEIARLQQAIPSVLEAAIACGGTTLRDRLYRGPRGEIGEFCFELAVYGRAGEPCRRCGNPIERTVLGGRGTYFCPHCQT